MESKNNLEKAKDCPQCKRLMNALDDAIDIGVYPRVFVGRYKKRTQCMNGWNAHSFAVIRSIIKSLGKKWDYSL